MTSSNARNWVIIFIAACLFVIAVGCSGSQSSRGRDEENTNALTLAQYINTERQNRGVGILTWDFDIAAVEQAHAEWLAAKDPPGPYIYPYIEVGEGDLDFAGRLDSIPFTYTAEEEYGYADENYTNASLVFNLLPDDVFTNASYTKFGIGYTRPPDRQAGKHYWVIGLVDD